MCVHIAKVILIICKLIICTPVIFCITDTHLREDCNCLNFRLPIFNVLKYEKFENHEIKVVSVYALDNMLVSV